jgi:hypothetical protein
MKNAKPDTGIPVLTEIISHGSDEVAAGNRNADNTSSFPVSTETEKITEPTEVAAIADWIDDEWNNLERKIRERVLHQLIGRIDFVLEQRIRDSIADILELAVEKLSTEIKRGLQQTLEEVITRAVSQEIIKINIKKY